ncbi:hypothetical protein [Vulcanisaeta thermophila]|uniref:hypothetical protein n=1 Tax=Vulcanisaeta thermophila TaxID=867917 RepID=UPI0008532BEA|nr:hypothetical protein [Vulcanisaeta thermophila]
MSSSIPEFLRSSVKVKEVINGVEVNSFKVPPHKFFVNEELTYLALALPYNVNERVLESKISELKLGRKTIEKLYAIRLDSEPWQFRELELPDLNNNDVDGTVVEAKGNAIYSAYIHVNGIRNFLKVTTLRFPSYLEIDVIRLSGYSGIVRYLVYFTP